MRVLIDLGGYPTTHGGVSEYVALDERDGRVYYIASGIGDDGRLVCEKTPLVRHRSVPSLLVRPDERDIPVEDLSFAVSTKLVRERLRELN